MFTPLLTGVVTPVVILIALFTLHWQMGLVALATLPVLLGVFVLTARLGQRADHDFQHNAALTSQRMVEFAQAQSVLRAFNGEDGGTQFLEQAIARQQQAAKHLIHVSAMSVVFNAWAVQAGFAALLVAATLWLGDLLGAGLEVGSVIAVMITLLLVSRFIDPLLEVAGYSEVLRGARGQLGAVREILQSSHCRSHRHPRHLSIAPSSCAMSASLMPRASPRCCAMSACASNRAA